MTDLHTPSDRTADPGSDLVDAEAANHRTFRAATLDEAVAAARSELGPEVELVEAHRVRRGGLGGFFATDLGVEIVAAPSRRRPASRPAGSPPPPPTQAERDEPRIATGIDRLIERVESAEMAEMAETSGMGGPSAAVRDALAGAIADAIGSSHPFDEQMRNERMRADLGPSVSTPTATPTAPPARPRPPAAPLSEIVDRPDSALDAVAAAVARGERTTSPTAPIPPLVDPLAALDDELAEATVPSTRSTIDELDLALARHAASPIDPVGDDAGLGAPAGPPVDAPAPDTTGTGDSTAIATDAFEAFEPDRLQRNELAGHAFDTRVDGDVTDRRSDTEYDTVLDDDIEIVDGADVLDRASDVDDDTEIIGPDEGEWAPGEAALRQRKKELDRTLGALEEIDDLLRDVGVNVPARADAIGTALVRAEPAPVEEIARVATSQLVEGIAALDGRCSTEIRRVSVSVTGTDGTTVCMSTELGDRRG